MECKNMAECEYAKYDKHTSFYYCEHYDGSSCRNGELLQAQAEHMRLLVR